MGLAEQLHRLEDATLGGWFEARLDRVVGPTGEERLFVHRRHWLVLVGPTALAVVACAVVLSADVPRVWFVALAVAIVLFERWRHRWSQARTAIAAAVWAVPFWVTLGLPTELFRAGAVVAVAGWLLVAVARWSCEALVLTETSLWKLSGVLSTSSPRAPLSRILFQDVRQTTVEQWFGCGRLAFDTAATSDDPLAHFGPVADPFRVSATIHRQRLRSLPGGRGAGNPPPVL